MDNRREVRDFLVSRRAKVTPDQVGLPADANRRVPGLRRSEVATIAGQVVRLLVAAPGSASGRYPEGNTGRAAIGIRQPLPVPDDLARVLNYSA